MKKINRLLIAVITSVVLLTAFTTKKITYPATTLTGAWGYGPPENRTVMICTGNIFAVANYDLVGKKLLHSFGGTFQIEGNTFIQKTEWNSKDSAKVGTSTSLEITSSNNTLSIKQTNEKWERLDDGTPGALAGTWIITGNYVNDKASKRANPFYPRRTMKVLSGKYFHWIAYNVVTKQFLNAGGGSYTTVNGKYTEKIDFFTKTAESVGKSLSFDYSFVDGDWRHKGEKSTGGALDECWTKRETFEK